MELHPNSHIGSNTQTWWLLLVSAPLRLKQSKLSLLPEPGGPQETRVWHCSMYMQEHTYTFKAAHGNSNTTKNSLGSFNCLSGDVTKLHTASSVFTNLASVWSLMPMEPKMTERKVNIIKFSFHWMERLLSVVLKFCRINRFCVTSHCSQHKKLFKDKVDFSEIDWKAPLCD